MKSAMSSFLHMYTLGHPSQQYENVYCIYYLWFSVCISNKIMLSKLSSFVNSPGDYGKLGHGNSQTHKAPKLIEGNLSGKVNINV